MASSRQILILATPLLESNKENTSDGIDHFLADFRVKTLAVSTLLQSKRNLS